MPQLDIFIFQSAALWATVVFFFLSYIFYTNILPKIFSSLKTRKLFLNKQTLSTQDIKITTHTPILTQMENINTEIKTRIKTLNSLND